MALHTRFLLGIAALMFMLPSSASAARLYLDPDTGTYGPGDTFVLQVRLDNQDECINAASVEISYPTSVLRAVDFGRGNSIFSMWVTEPTINTDKGTIVFSGGVPGGYCGRIQGDPALSNVLGKIVFTVVKSSQPRALIHFLQNSLVYLNDGLGTEAPLSFTDASIAIASTSVAGDNPWLKEVQSDIIPPEPFAVEMQSTAGVFGGRYYVVFSTTDKQSGLDHFEIYEDNAWKRISSPYLLPNQSFFGVPGNIQVRAIDKAGNGRVGDYSKESVPPRQYSFNEFIPLLIAVCIILLGGSIVLFMDHRRKKLEKLPSK